MKKNIISKLLIVYTITAVIISVTFFPVLPILLNYPPDSINNEFQRGIDIGLSYNQQYILIISISYIISIMSILYVLRDLKEIEKLSQNALDQVKSKIAKRLLNIPYKLYVAQTIVPFVIINLLYALVELQINMGTIKIAIVILTFQLLIALFVFIYSKKLIVKMLEKIFLDKKFIKSFISLRIRLFIILLPMILVALIFTSLIGYSRVIEEKSEYMYLYYSKLLNSKFNENVYNKDDAISLLKEIELKQKDDYPFIIYPDGKCDLFGKEEVTDFFVKYTLEKSEDQGFRSYETYGIDKQASIMKIYIDGDIAYIGIMFNIVSIKTIIYFFVSILFLFLLNGVVLYYVLKYIADDINTIVNALDNISENKEIQQKYYLPVTSNDEIGELVIAFNKIQDLTNEHIEKLVNQQDIIDKQGRLTVLGELAGGMAHDINTPVATINTGLLMLEKDLSKEDKEAVIANIKLCTQKINDIVNSVRDQIRNLGSSNKETFNLNKLVNEILVLIQSELIKSGCNVNIDINENIDIYGESNKLRTSN